MKASISVVFFGTPHGFEKVVVGADYELDLDRFLDIDVTGFELQQQEYFYRIVQRNTKSGMVLLASIYTYAQEEKAARAGGFCAACLIIKNAWPRSAAHLVRALNASLAFIYERCTKSGKFICSIRDGLRDKTVPAEIAELSASLIESDLPSSGTKLASAVGLTVGASCDFLDVQTAIKYCLDSQLPCYAAEVLVYSSGNLSNRLVKKRPSNILSNSDSWASLAALHVRVERESNRSLALLRRDKSEVEQRLKALSEYSEKQRETHEKLELELASMKANARPVISHSPVTVERRQVNLSTPTRALTSNAPFDPATLAGRSEKPQYEPRSAQTRPIWQAQCRGRLRSSPRSVARRSSPRRMRHQLPQTRRLLQAR